MTPTACVDFAGPQTAELVAGLSQPQIPTTQWLAAIGIIITAAAISGTVYDLLISPLRAVPGPLLWRISTFPWSYYCARGELPQKLRALHEAYGAVVRIRPCEVSFSSPQAWKDIYGLRSRAAASAAGRPFHPELSKYAAWYKAIEEEPDGILTASRERHAVIRSALSPGFSERSMQAQQPTFLRFVDQLMAKFRERASSGPGPGPGARTRTPVNVVVWFNYTTFDIISELAYGESFQCLNNNTYHRFLRQLLTSTREQGVLRAAKLLLGPSRAFKALRWWFIPTHKAFRQDVMKSLLSRLAMGEARDHDFVAGLVEMQKKDNGITFDELSQSVVTLILAGSETTATTLAAVTYFLLANPEAHARVVAEVRKRFASEHEITLHTVNRLPYMLACLNEALRLYPPVPGGTPRVVPPGGDVIDNVAVPAGTVVSVTQLAASQLTSNWADAPSFRPERWLGAAGFENDTLNAMQPFSVGPRNCIGKNLAYAEMRLILAKTLFNFDLELAPESKNWLVGQKAYIIWQKPPLHVYFKSARGQ